MRCRQGRAPAVGLQCNLGLALSFEASGTTSRVSVRPAAAMSSLTTSIQSWFFTCLTALNRCFTEEGMGCIFLVCTAELSVLQVCNPEPAAVASKSSYLAVETWLN